MDKNSSTSPQEPISSKPEFIEPQVIELGNLRDLTSMPLSGDGGGRR